GGPDDGVGTEPAEAEGDAVGDEDLPGEHVPAEIRPSQPEVGVSESVDHRVGLEIAVGGADRPVPLLALGGATDGDLALVTIAAANEGTVLTGGVAGSSVVEGDLADLGGLASEVPDHLALESDAERGGDVEVDPEVTHQLPVVTGESKVLVARGKNGG